MRISSVRKTDGEPGSQAPRRIRVALILYRDDLNLGGSLRVVEMLAHALDPERVEAHIVFTYGGPGPSPAGAASPVTFCSRAVPGISALGSGPAP